MRPACTFHTRDSFVTTFRLSSPPATLPSSCSSSSYVTRAQNNWPGQYSNSSDNIKSSFNLASSRFFQSSKFDEIHWEVGRVFLFKVERLICHGTYPRFLWMADYVRDSCSPWTKQLVALAGKFGNATKLNGGRRYLFWVAICCVQYICMSLIVVALDSSQTH